MPAFPFHLSHSHWFRNGHGNPYQSEPPIFARTARTPSLFLTSLTQVTPSCEVELSLMRMGMTPHLTRAFGINSHTSSQGSTWTKTLNLGPRGRVPSVLEAESPQFWRVPEAVSPWSRKPSPLSQARLSDTQTRFRLSRGPSAQLAAETSGAVMILVAVSLI